MASNRPASGYRAPGVNTGAAPSPTSPNRASARPASRDTGPGSTPRPCPPPAPAPASGGAASRAPSRPPASPPPASSPPSQQNVTSPCTHTTPPPSALVTTPTPGAISVAPAGSNGSGAWVSITVIIPPRSRLLTLHLFFQIHAVKTRSDTPENARKNQVSSPVTARQRIAMSGARVSRKESGGDVEGRQHEPCCASDGGLALRARRAGGGPEPPEAALGKSPGGGRCRGKAGEDGSGERREDEHVRTTADASKDIQMASKLRIGTRPRDKGAPAGGPSARELPA